jgi:hypothetical protein
MNYTELTNRLKKYHNQHRIYPRAYIAKPIMVEDNEVLSRGTTGSVIVVMDWMVFLPDDLDLDKISLLRNETNHLHVPELDHYQY